ncbi:leucine-rich repeat domain-containing protein [Bremerella volcania]|uniref:hypothetical protein n=1 Tax=Bremerella volcania TaxID=2527984 RepID=UPI0013FD0639|nr:hypothetical protein [Bremerella volcania]
MQLTTAAILILSAVTMQAEAPSRAEIDARFQAQLSELAAKCDEVKLPEQAELTRKWIVPRYGQANLFYLVPESDPLQPDGDASQLVQFWYQKFRSIRNEHADALYKHAQEMLIAKQGAKSYQTLHEVLRENPDHTDARRILGYANVNGTWRRPGVVTRAKQPRYEHPKFGWPAKSFWQIDTPHFQIMTNLSEAEGLKLGERLEIVYSAWEQMFFSYWSNELQLAGYFDGGSPSPVRKKFEVVLFKTRGEYVNYLEQVQPRIGITLGIYQFDEEKVYLFHDESEAAHATWHHEVSHQLFQEYRSASKDVGLNFNFWAIEGVAMYMESLRIFDGYVTLGGIDATRLQFARNRYFNDDSRISFAELVSLGRSELQKRPDIGALYSESAGRTHYYLDYPEDYAPESQKWREPFIEYLKEIYLGRDTVHSLGDKVVYRGRIGTETFYMNFLSVFDEDILALPQGAPTTDLVLGSMDTITDAALARIGTFEKLRWLDLTKTSITDSGIAHLTGCRSLRDLSIATTHISDRSLATVGKLKTLEELDISGTPVTDAGLAHLSSLSNLKVLRMAVTQITDEGLLKLAGLKDLEMIDARQTRITPQGVERLKQSLPKVVVHH